VTCPIKKVVKMPVNSGLSLTIVKKRNDDFSLWKAVGVQNGTDETGTESCRSGMILIYWQESPLGSGKPVRRDREGCEKKAPVGEILYRKPVAPESLGNQKNNGRPYLFLMKK